MWSVQRFGQCTTVQYFTSVPWLRVTICVCHATHLRHDRHTDMRHLESLVGLPGHHWWVGLLLWWASREKDQQSTMTPLRGLSYSPRLGVSAGETANQLEDDAVTTIETVTRAQLETLRDEAGSAGDSEQVAICNKALEGDEAAVAECVRVMQEAEAQCPFQKGDAVVLVGQEGRFPGTVVEEAEYGSRTIAKANDFAKRIGFLPGEDGTWRNFTKWSLEKA